VNDLYNIKLVLNYQEKLLFENRMIKVRVDVVLK
jgi:hypothetical protein